MNITLDAVKQVAEENNISVLQAITLMQTGAAKQGNNDALEQLCAIKSEIIGL